MHGYRLERSSSGKLRRWSAIVKQFKSDALASVHETVLGLEEAGVIAEQTMRAFDETCLTPVEDLTPEEIREIR